MLLVPDGANPGMSVLLVGGTTTGDDIEVRRGSDSPEVRVLMHDGDSATPDLEDFVNISRVEVFGGQGDDRLFVDAEHRFHSGAARRRARRRSPYGRSWG